MKLVHYDVPVTIGDHEGYNNIECEEGTLLLAALKLAQPYLHHYGPLMNNPDFECGNDCPRCHVDNAIAAVEGEGK